MRCPRELNSLTRAVAALEAWWEAEDYRPGREACLERLRQEGRFDPDMKPALP